MAAQPLNQADAQAVRQVIVSRCVNIVANYALYNLGLPTGTGQGEASETKKGWCRQALLNAGTIGDQVSWHVLNQTDFKENGSGIADNTLKGIVETALGAHFVPEEPQA